MSEVVFSSAIAHVIQLAVAPVFMLTSVGAFLTVLTNRFSRIVDRSRKLEEQGEQLEDKRQLELRILGKRARLINWSISFFTLGASLTCMMIAALFIADFVHLDASIVIASLFIMAMLCLIGGLLLFQREIYLAIRTMKLMSE